MEIGETYRSDVKSIKDGDVLTWDGRPVHFRTLIKRRWGWPKRAASLAAEKLKEWAGSNAQPCTLQTLR